MLCKCLGEEGIIERECLGMPCCDEGSDNYLTAHLHSQVSEGEWTVYREIVRTLAWASQWDYGGKFAKGQGETWSRQISVSVRSTLVLEVGHNAVQMQVAWDHFLSEIVNHART